MLPPMPSPDAPKNQTDPELTNPVIEYFSEHPISGAMLAASMIGGAILGYYVFEGTLSTPRSILGGAISGFGSWLLVTIGRVIGD